MTESLPMFVIVYRVFRGLQESGPDYGTDDAELQAAIAGEKKLDGQQAGGGNDISIDAVRNGWRK